MQEVLLTIGIPTYNRASLLVNILECIYKQIKSLSSSEGIQIVVSDNKSTDNTRKVVDNFINKGLYIDYSCNEENIGANNNIIKIGYELAKGDFCWIIGDDDLIRDGGISYYLEILKKNQNLDVFYINHTFDNDEDRKEITERSTINWNRLMCVYNKDEVFSNCEKILELTPHDALFTCLSSFIFKTKVWQDNFIGYQRIKPFNSLSNTFPHTVILSKSLISKSVYFVNHPYLAFFIGAQGWFNDWELILASRVLDLTDLFESLGASKSFLKEYRERIFKKTTNAFYKKLKEDKNLPEWFDINYKKVNKKYGKYEEFKKMSKYLKARLMKEKIKTLLRIGN